MNDLFSKDWSYSEQYRHECELRYICGLTLNARRRYLALVLENRGIKAQQHLKDELEKIWKAKAKQ